MAKNQIAASIVQDNEAAPVTKLELSAEVAEKYRLKGINPGRYYFPGHGEIDLTSVTLAKADHLVKRGFPYLVLKNKKGPEDQAVEA